MIPASCRKASVKALRPRSTAPRPAVTVMSSVQKEAIRARSRAAIACSGRCGRFELPLDRRMELGVERSPHNVKLGLPLQYPLHFALGGHSRVFLERHPNHLAVPLRNLTRSV